MSDLERQWPPAPPLLFAIGHVFLVALVPKDLTFSLPPSPAVSLLIVAELLLFGVLILPSLRRPPRLQRTVIVAVTTGLLVGILLFGLAQTDTLWLVALGIGVLTALLAYGVHRYELLVTGQVEAVDQ